LSSAPGLYSRLASMILDTIPSSLALAFLDDILVMGATHEEHLAVLEKVIDRHILAGVKLQAAKCHLFRTEVDYLGFKVKQNSVAPIESYLEVLRSWPVPQDQKSLVAWYGKLQYYSGFLPAHKFAALSSPLHKARTRKPFGKLTEEELNCFKELNNCFAIPEPCLFHIGKI